VRSHYLSYIVPFQLINDKLEQYEQIIFYLDILSISRGFYNKRVIDMETNNYIQNQEQMPNIYPLELKHFLNNIYSQFKEYEPIFILFYDGGECLQNKIISSSYKEERVHSQESVIMENIKNHYLNLVELQFNKPNLSYVFRSQKYELDLIPHYIIKNNYFDSKQSHILNVILSIDKDLLQTCMFENTVQAVSTYKKATGTETKLYDKYNALSYIYRGFKRGGLTAEYIPLILALSSDRIDGIRGIPGVGPASAVKLIQMYNLPPIIKEDTILPDKLKLYTQLIVNNLKLTCFDLQIERIPTTELEKIVIFR